MRSRDFGVPRETRNIRGTSVVFLAIHDKLLIAKDFDPCLASILAAMASPSDPSIVVGGGLARMSAANTVLEKRWWRVFVGHIRVRHR